MIDNKFRTSRTPDIEHLVRVMIGFSCLEPAVNPSDSIAKLAQVLKIPPQDISCEQYLGYSDKLYLATTFANRDEHLVRQKLEEWKKALSLEEINRVGGDCESTHLCDLDYSRFTNNENLEVELNLQNRILFVSIIGMVR